MPKKGFTLIELMVVVAIIAILALVSLGIFNGAQGNARDSRRMREIQSLAKNIESTKDPVTGNYFYGSTLYGKDYPNGQLKDPGDATNPSYCIEMLDIDTRATPPANWNSGSTLINGCPKDSGPGGWLLGLNGINDNTFKKDGSGYPYFLVCAHSERGTKAICQGPFTK